jgi:hypothetical protein
MVAVVVDLVLTQALQEMEVLGEVEPAEQEM